MILEIRFARAIMVRIGGSPRDWGSMVASMLIYIKKHNQTKFRQYYVYFGYLCDRL